MDKLKKGEGQEINEYYLRISKKLRNMKYLLLLCMAGALIITLWAYRNRLTYDNFRYLLRDMDEAGNTAVSTDSVYYTANDTNNYMYFRGDLAIASSDGVRLHRALGNRSFKDEISLRAPSLAVSDKYMVAYDVGGKSFYVYNSISRVYSETTEHEIIDCAAASNGSFAVLTKNNIGGSLVRIYDKNFKLIGEITREEYAYSLEFLSDGRLSIALCLTDGVSLYTNLLLYTPQSEDIDTTVRVGGLVLLCGKTSGGYFVLCDSSVSFFNDSGERVFHRSFGTATVLYADTDGERVCVLLDQNTIGAKCGVYVFTKEGESHYSHIGDGARGVTFAKDAVCVLYDGRLLVLGGDMNREIEIPDGGKKLIGRHSDSVIVCYNDYAKIFDVK